MKLKPFHSCEDRDKKRKKANLQCCFTFVTINKDENYTVKNA